MMFQDNRDLSFRSTTINAPEEEFVDGMTMVVKIGQLTKFARREGRYFLGYCVLTFEITKAWVLVA